MSTAITSDQLEIVEDLNLNDFAIVGDDGPQAARLDMSASIILLAQNGVVATSGNDAQLTAGAGDNGNTMGAQVTCTPGKGDGTTHGKLSIMSDGVNGDLGQLLVNNFTDPDYGPVSTFGSLGDIKLEAHAAPADGDLAAGELRFWFDQTDGAAKLMIKAKQADGTVRTAAVNLA